MYAMRFTRQASKDARFLKAAGLSAKAKALVRVLEKDPLAAPPPFERLVGDLAGLYSRRINIQHRLVYQVFPEPFEEDGARYEGIVRVLRMWTHYEGVRR